MILFEYDGWEVHNNLNAVLYPYAYVHKKCGTYWGFSMKEISSKYEHMFFCYSCKSKIPDEVLFLLRMMK